MKKIHYIILLFVLIAPSTTTYAQGRPVYWIHGLNDDPDLWRLYAPLFQRERLLTGTSSDYSNNEGVVKASVNLDETFVGTNRDFLIGHSLGGLVARQYERTTFGPRPNAILTIGTPHNGAFLATNIINGNARQVVNNAINDMSAGPLAEGKSLVTSILPLYGPLGFIALRWANRAIDEATEDMFANLQTSLDAFEANINQQSLRDMVVGSTYLTGLNSAVRPVATANIICEENDRPGLRIAYAAIHPPENAPLHTYDDTGLIRATDKLHGAYKFFRIYHDIRKFTNFWRAGHHNRLANKWQRGEDFIDDKFDAEFARLVGSFRQERTTRRYRIQICESDCDPHLIRRPREGEEREICPPMMEGDCRWQWRTRTVTRTITEKTDGLVTDGTQHQAGVPADLIYRARGVNHLEVGNHPEATARYNDVFNRVDDFEIARRF